MYFEEARESYHLSFVICSFERVISAEWKGAMARVLNNDK